MTDLALKIFGEKPLDKRRKYYLIVDTETATLPVNISNKSKISLQYPLVYDIGWIITDINGNIYRTRNFLVNEIFSNYQIFSTAYHRDKREVYIEKLNNGDIIKADWEMITHIFEKDLSEIEGIGAYNTFFDLKKAIPFTEEYIKKFYSNEWGNWYNEKISEIEQKNEKTYRSKKPNPNYDNEIFEFRGMQYLVFDIWCIAVQNLLNSYDYKEKAVKNQWFTTSGKYFSTKAENAYRFIIDNDDFIESHTALSDVRIETKIFTKSVKGNKRNIKWGIQPFPYKILGTVENFIKGSEG